MRANELRSAVTGESYRGNPRRGRILPGETVATVKERVRKVIADSQIVVEPIDSVGVDPSPISDVNSGAYQVIASAIRSMTPGAPSSAVLHEWPSRSWPASSANRPICMDRRTGGKAA